MGNKNKPTKYTGFTESEVLLQLEQDVATAGSQKKFAQTAGIEVSRISRLMQRRENVSINLAEKLGYERKVIFVPISE